MSKALFLAIALSALAAAPSSAQDVANNSVTSIVDSALRRSGFTVLEMYVYGSTRDTKVELIVSDTLPYDAHVEMLDGRDSLLATFRRMPVNSPLDRRFAGAVGYAMVIVDTGVSSLATVRFA
jgi:hypothetical protein